MRFPKGLIYCRNLLLFSVCSLTSLMAFGAVADAKTPGKTYCFRGFCHRVLTLAETEKLVGTQTKLITSNYDDCKHDRFNPCGLTSSGAVFRADLADNAASPIYPDGTIILVRHPQTQKSAVLRVNSAGPYHGKRLLDVSRATAKALSFDRQGVATLDVRVLQAPSKAESTYKKNRMYAPVPGYLGAFASLDQAVMAYSGRTSTTAVAAIYPQSGGVDRSIAQQAGDITGVNSGRRWLAKAVAFWAPPPEFKAAKRAKAQRLAKLERRKHG